MQFGNFRPWELASVFLSPWTALVCGSNNNQLIKCCECRFQRSAWVRTQSMWLLCPAFGAPTRSVSCRAHSQCSLSYCESTPAFSFPFSHSLLALTHPQITNPHTNARSLWGCRKPAVICIRNKAAIFKAFILFILNSTGPRNLFLKLMWIQGVRVLRTELGPVKEVRTSSWQC